VYDKDPDATKALIMGAPGSEIILNISPPMPEPAAGVLAATAGPAPAAPAAPTPAAAGVREHTFVRGANGGLGVSFLRNSPAENYMVSELVPGVSFSLYAYMCIHVCMYVYTYTCTSVNCFKRIHKEFTKYLVEDELTSTK
jgi:hypothetical protein